MAMNEKNIKPVEACTCEVKCTPEQKINMLTCELKDERVKKEEAWDEIEKKNCQVHALVDVMCDLRNATKNLDNDLTWQRRRTGDYRDIHHEALMVCWDVISDYENKEKDKPSKAVYEFAKKIRDILRKI